MRVALRGKCGYQGTSVTVTSFLPSHAHTPCEGATIKCLTYGQERPELQDVDVERSFSGG